MADATLNSSILTSIKKLLGIEEEYEHFDTDIIIHINSVFLTLNQLGVGPIEGFEIENKEATWDSFLYGRKDFNSIKTYIYLKVKLIFDPPQMGYLVDAIKNQIAEFEWRLNVQAENTMKEECQNGST